jgi:hypothetical protein
VYNQSANFITIVNVDNVAPTIKPPYITYDGAKRGCAPYGLPAGRPTAAGGIAIGAGA